jgi:hypothetical protein
MSSLLGNDQLGAGNLQPGSPSWRAGVNRCRESQRRRQVSPIRWSASRITNERPSLARW